MKGIVIDINPVIFHIGGLTIGWYGLIVAVALLVAVLVATRKGQRRGISKETIYSLALWSFAGGLLGARLFHVIDKLDYYLANPRAILAFGEGGLAIWGGLAGGALAGVLYGKWKGLPLGRLADTVAPALLSGQIIGRVACIINGDAYGGPTSMPWGFIYTHPGAIIPQRLWGVPTHPYPVYEMLWNIVLLAVLWKLRPRLKTGGLLFFFYLSFYSLGRFILTFVRQEESYWWGLQQAQIISLFAFAISTTAFAYLFLGRQRRAGAVPPQAPSSGRPDEALNA